MYDSNKIEICAGAEGIQKVAYGIGESKANVQWQKIITQIWKGGNKSKVKMHDCCQS